jgi:hypothetical protein
MKLASKSPLILIWLFIASVSAGTQAEVGHGGNKKDSVWQHLDQGLELGIFLATQSVAAGAPRINVLRIDPNIEFELLRIRGVNSAISVFFLSEFKLYRRGISD